MVAGIDDPIGVGDHDFRQAADGNLWAGFPGGLASAGRGHGGATGKLRSRVRGTTAAYVRSAEKNGAGASDHSFPYARPEFPAHSTSWPDRCRDCDRSYQYQPEPALAPGCSKPARAVAQQARIYQFTAAVRGGGFCAGADTDVLEITRSRYCAGNDWNERGIHCISIGGWALLGVIRRQDIGGERLRANSRNVYRVSRGIRN